MYFGGSYSEGSKNLNFIEQDTSEKIMTIDGNAGSYSLKLNHDLIMENNGEIIDLF